jgi:tRNA (cytidine/uridine-2'-O-)-methyltransferase
MKIILFQPQIPQNTGNIVRTCSVTGVSLVLVKPLGFSVSDRHLKRAGLDYWEGVNVEIIEDLEAFLEKEKGAIHLFTSKAKKWYTDQKYKEEDVLIFGSETEGLPKKIIAKYQESCVKIPMIDGARCLNLATCVGIALFEAKRQLNFESLM